ncbi:MAG: serine hydrolase [Vulcanimicrobiaceae bacterium]
MLVVFACAASFAVSASPAAAIFLPAPLERLHVRLDALRQHAPGHIALEVEDLATGLAIGVNERTSMPAASTIKIPVMVEVFKQMELGSIGLNSRVHLEARDRDYGSGDICDARTGTAFSVRTLLDKMIDESDNTAANMLIRLVGRTHVNRTMRDLGLRQTELRSDIRTASNGIRYTLRTSASDMVRLLARMAQNRLVDSWSSREMLAILANQQINTLLPVPLPHDVTIAHKTGSLHDTLNDVGIVEQEGEPYVIAVMTTNLRSLWSGRDFIRHVSLLAYDSLEKLATWRVAQGFPAFIVGGLPPAEAPDQTLSLPAAPVAPDELAPIVPAADVDVAPGPEPAALPANDGTIAPPQAGVPAAAPALSPEGI